MAQITFALTLNDCRLTTQSPDGEFASPQGLSFKFEGRDDSPSFHAVRLTTGKWLSDLPVTITVNSLDQADLTDNESVGILSHCEAAAYGHLTVDERLDATLYLPRPRFEEMERWVRDDCPPKSVSLRISEPLDDGPQISEENERTWDVNLKPTLSITGITFHFPVSERQVRGASGNVYGPLNQLPTRDSAKRDLVESAIKKHFGALDQRGQTRSLVELLVASVDRYCATRPDPAYNFEFRAPDALRFLRELQKALNPPTSDDSWRSSYVEEFLSLPGLTEHEKNDAKNNIWSHRNVVAVVRDGKKVRDYWPISADELSELCFEYLKHPEYELPELELIMVDALIYRTTLAVAESTKEVLAGILGQITGANSGSTLRLAWFSAAKSGAGSIVRLCLAAVTGFAAAGQHGWWAGVLTSVALWAMLRYLQVLNSNGDDIKRQVQLLEHMLVLSNSLADSRISPAYIKQRLLAVADRGAVWPTAAIALVERAAQRSPVAWKT